MNVNISSNSSPTYRGWGISCLNLVKALMEEGLMEKYILVCREDYPQLLDNGILILPYKDFLSDLWGGRIL